MSVSDFESYQFNDVRSLKKLLSSLQKIVEGLEENESQSKAARRRADKRIAEKKKMISEKDSVEKKSVRGYLSEVEIEQVEKVKSKRKKAEPKSKKVKNGIEIKPVDCEKIYAEMRNQQSDLESLLEEKPEKVKKEFICECGSVIKNPVNKARHLRSKKHLESLEQN